MRDRSEKPADQCSDNEIGRGLVTDSPIRLFGEYAQNKIIKKRIYLQGFENLAGKQRKKTQNLSNLGS